MMMASTGWLGLADSWGEDYKLTTTRQWGRHKAPPLPVMLSIAGTLAANTVQAAQSAPTMRIGPAGAALIATAVRPPVGGDAVVTAERGAAFNRAFSVRGALFTETAITAPLIATERTTDALNAMEASAAMRAGRAAATIAPAAVERPVTGDAVVVTGDGSAVLAALIRRRALATEANRAAAATTTAADAVDAEETTATIRILGTGAAIVPAAVEGAVGVDAVRCTDGRAAGLAALPGLVALGPNSQSAGRVVRADAVDAIEATTAVGAI